MATLLVVILVLALIGALPRWSFNRDWGYAPSALVTVILVIVIVRLLIGPIW